MHMPNAKAALAMLISALVGLLAGLVVLKAMGEPTPLG